jgi:branched-chain amino acid transport system permease protein
MNSWFLANEVMVQSALVFSMLAMSFQICLRAGVSSFAGVGFWAIGAYLAAILVKEHNWATAPALAAAVVVAAVGGILLGLILGRLRSLYLAMATVAFVVLVQTLANTWESVTGGVVGYYAIPIRLSTAQLAVLVVVVVALVFVTEQGRRGRALQAIRLDERLAPSLGINVRRTRIVSFAAGAAVAGLSGGCYSLMFNVIAPENAGFSLIVNTLMMIIIGGVTSWIGPLVGAFVVTWLPTWLAFMGESRPALQGVIVLLIVVYSQDGIVGVLQSIRRTVKEKRASANRPPLDSVTPVAEPEKVS